MFFFVVGIVCNSYKSLHRVQDAHIGLVHNWPILNLLCIYTIKNIKKHLIKIIFFKVLHHWSIGPSNADHGPMKWSNHGRPSKNWPGIVLLVYFFAVTVLAVFLFVTRTTPSCLSPFSPISDLPSPPNVLKHTSSLSPTNSLQHTWEKKSYFFFVFLF